MDMTSLELVRHGAPATAPTVDRDIRLEIDRLLEQGLEFGEWAAVRASLGALPESRDSYEGYHLGLATASFYADDDLDSAERALDSALKAPDSRWRPDSFRLLALVLHQQGRTGEAQEAVERGMQAVDQLALDDDASASYRTWVGQALRDGVDQPPELRTAKSAQLLDEWLDEAYATGDWALCRRRLESAFQGNSSPEGACFGRAAACFHIDQDAGAAEDWLRVALRKPESRWRPDICRLLGVILQSRGDLSAAETALDAGLDAVPRLNFSDEEKARYTDWIELVLQPVRGRLLEKDRGGIKSVLRNGILTGERSDKRECREALLALKEIERNWTPDFISALLFAPVWRPMVAFVRAVYRGALRCMRVAVRLSPRVAKSAFLVVTLGAIGYGALKFTASMCAGSSGGFCTGATAFAIAMYLGACEQMAAMAWSLFTGLSAIASGGDLAKLPEEAANATVILLLVALLTPPAAYLIAKLAIQKTTRYALVDGRLTIEEGIFRRQRRNFEILHASHFEIQQDVLPRFLGRARFIFHTVSVGGQHSEPAIIYGRRKTILTLDKQIRGIVRTLRTVARLKGIVAVD